MEYIVKFFVEQLTKLLVLGLPVALREEGPPDISGDVDLAHHWWAIFSLDVLPEVVQRVSGLLEKRKVILCGVWSTGQLQPEVTWLVSHVWRMDIHSVVLEEAL